MKLKEGDSVRILDVDSIEMGSMFFQNGDTTTLTTYRGYLVLKHDAPELEGGLVLSFAEYPYVGKINWVVSSL